MSYSTIVILGTVSMVASVVSGFALFGDAIFTYLLLSIILYFAPTAVEYTGAEGSKVESFHSLVLLLAARAFFMSTTMCWLVRKEAQIKILLILAPFIICGTLIGCYILDHYGDSKYLHPFFAVILSGIGLCCVGSRMIKSYWSNKKEQEEKETKEAEAKETKEPVIPTINFALGQFPSSPIHDTNSQNENSNKNNVENIQDFPDDTTTNNNDTDVQNNNTSTKMTDAEYDKMKLSDPIFMRNVKLFMCIGGFGAGFLGALCNIASAPVVIIVILQEHPKTLARGLLPFIFQIVFTTRTIYSGASTYNMDRYSAMWKETLACVSGGLIGLLAGNALASKIGNEKYLSTVSSLLLIGGLVLGDISVPIVLIVIAFTSFWVYRS